MKRYQATIREIQIESAMELPAWQYRRGESFKTGCSWYPFEDEFCHIIFEARNRIDACKQLEKCGVLARDVSEV